MHRVAPITRQDSGQQPSKVWPKLWLTQAESKYGLAPLVAMSICANNAASGLDGSAPTKSSSVPAKQVSNSLLPVQVVSVLPKSTSV
jgi:hypothetical protein